MGRVAAVNALNDVYAKGAVPRFAMAVVEVPSGHGAAVLAQTLAGVRCTLDAAPAVTANQQLLVVCVHDSLWTMQYAPPAELPIETKASPIT